MSSSWNFIFGAILIIIWIIAGGFITQANIYLTPYKDTDPNFHEAYWSSFWAAFITWGLIALFILLIIILFATGVGEVGLVEGSAERSILEQSSAKGYVSTGISWIAIAFLAVALVLVALTGGLATVAASNIAASKNYDPKIPKLKIAYNDCIVAAIICVGATGILIIALITYFVIAHNNARNEKAKVQ